jgi:hypothetical protein
MNRKERSETTGSQAADPEELEPNRREFLVGMGGTAVLGILSGPTALAQASQSALNIARVAVPTSQVMASENKISALNDGYTPVNSFDRTHSLYALWAVPSTGSRTNWVQYEWSESVTVDKIDIYWAVDHPLPGALPGSSAPRIAALLERKRIRSGLSTPGSWRSSRHVQFDEIWTC